MAPTYTLNFSDTGKIGFSLFPFTTNGPVSPSDPTLIPQAVTARTTLKLYGRGLTDFGEAFAQNSVYMLENFANSSRPVNSIDGQLWYATNIGSPPVNELFIRNSNANDIAGGPGWDGIILATGSTPMANELILSGNPILPLGAAPKQYIDTLIAATTLLINDATLLIDDATLHINDATLHITLAQNMFIDGLLLGGSPAALTAPDVNQLIGITSNVQQQINGKLNTIGDNMAAAANLTLSGGGEVLGLPMIPSVPDAAASRAYVDSIVVGGGGGGGGGDGVLNAVSFIAPGGGPVVTSDTTLEFSIIAGSPPTPSVITIDGISRIGHGHNAGDIVNTPTGNIIATDIQAAIDELDTEKAALLNPIFTNTITVVNSITAFSASFTGQVSGIIPDLPNHFTTKQYVDDLAALHSDSFYIDVDTAGAVMTDNALPVGWTTTYIGVGNFTITHNLATGLGSPPVSLYGVGSPLITEPGFSLLVIYNGTARVLNPTVINGDDISFQITDTLNAAVEGQVVGKLLFTKAL